MNKKLIASIATTLVLAVGVFAFVSVWFGQDAVQAQAQQNPPTPAVQSSAPSQAELQLQEEIAELRAMIQALLGAQAGVPQMSSQAAMNIAVEHLGFGTAEGTELIEAGGVLMFSVDVVNGAVRYVVHVNAMTGAVMNFNTTGTVSGAASQQPVQPQQPPAQPPASSTHTPGSSSSSNRSSSSSSSPSGR